jgi:outer membrane lipopolysaccharide assembly protein LptE/RlpB
MSSVLTKMRMLRWLSMAIVAGLLSGCGWQLQGAHRVPEYVAPLYLDLVDIHSPFAESLRQRLLQSGVPVVENRTGAKAVLYVTIDNSNHRVASVSSTNEPQQFEVYYDIVYHLDQQSVTTDSAGASVTSSTNLLPQQSFNLSRNMSYDKTLALAKQREEMLLRTTLAGELADQLMRRLSMLPAAPVAETPAAATDASAEMNPAAATSAASH